MMKKPTSSEIHTAMSGASVRAQAAQVLVDDPPVPGDLGADDPVAKGFRERADAAVQVREDLVALLGQLALTREPDLVHFGLGALAVLLKHGLAVGPCFVADLGRLDASLRQRLLVLFPCSREEPGGLPVAGGR